MRKNPLAHEKEGLHFSQYTVKPSVMRPPPFEVLTH
jgi:hypothetical protein